MTTPVVLVEVGLRHALDVRGVTFVKMSNSPSAVRDVVVDDRGVRQVQRLLLIRLAADDVVARELVLRALQFVRRSPARASASRTPRSAPCSPPRGVCPGCSTATA